MRFQGKVYKDGNFWLAEVPIFDAMTQGHTRKEALAMIVDWFETLADSPGFSIQVYAGKKGEFGLSAPDTKIMIRLLLQRKAKPSHAKNA